MSIGLCAALSGKGHAVQPFKKGPDYIDPLWLAKASARACYNLDFNCQQHEEILSLFGQNLTGSDIGLIEGNKGLYDGMALDGSDSNAAMAKLLGAPVVLVIDAQGITRGVAPLLLGYQQFDPDINIAGVIFNKVAGDRQEGKLLQVVEHYTDIPVLGAVRRNSSLSIEERHLGLVPSNEEDAAEELIKQLSKAVDQQVDLDRLVDVAATSKIKPFTLTNVIQNPQRVKIGVARDAAFGFYYQDDLQNLEQAGAELVYFSPLSDQKLPEIDGLFFGGGFPETHMEQLQANPLMLQSVKTFIENDGPAYAECGGLMYLCRSLQWDGKVCKMADVIPADAVMYERPQGRGLVYLKELDSHPWQGVESGQEYRVHEFHYSRLENLEGNFDYAYQVTRGTGIDGEHDGLIYKNLLAGYAHQRHVDGNQWTRRFVDFVANSKQ